MSKFFYALFLFKQKNASSTGCGSTTASVTVLDIATSASASTDRCTAVRWIPNCTARCSPARRPNSSPSPASAASSVQVRSRSPCHKTLKIRAGSLRRHDMFASGSSFSTTLMTTAAVFTKVSITHCAYVQPVEIALAIIFPVFIRQLSGLFLFSCFYPASCSLLCCTRNNCRSCAPNVSSRAPPPTLALPT